MLNAHFVPVLMVTTALVMMAEQPSINGKPDFTGKWRLQTSSAQSTPTWIIDQSEERIHIRELKAPDEAITDVQCGTKATECPGRVEGKDAKVVFYYNGPKLVQITRKGKDVSKTVRTLSDDGQKITMEVVSYEPAGNPETFALVKAETAEQNTSAKVQ